MQPPVASSPSVSRLLSALTTRCVSLDAKARRSSRLSGTSQRMSAPSTHRSVSVSGRSCWCGRLPSSRVVACAVASACARFSALRRPSAAASIFSALVSSHSPALPSGASSHRTLTHSPKRPLSLPLDGATRASPERCRPMRSITRAWSVIGRRTALSMQHREVSKSSSLPRCDGCTLP